MWILSSYFVKFGLKDPIKIPILSGLEKICHIPHVIFQTTGCLLYLFYLLTQVMHSVSGVLPCAHVTCIAYSNIIYVVTKQRIKGRTRFLILPKIILDFYLF